MWHSYLCPKGPNWKFNNILVHVFFLHCTDTQTYSTLISTQLSSTPLLMIRRLPWREASINKNLMKINLQNIRHGRWIMRDWGSFTFFSCMAYGIRWYRNSCTWCHKWEIIPSDNSWVQDGYPVFMSLNVGWIPVVLSWDPSSTDWRTHGPWTQEGIDQSTALGDVAHNFLGPIRCRNFCYSWVL